MTLYISQLALTISTQSAARARRRDRETHLLLTESLLSMSIEQEDRLIRVEQDVSNINFNNTF